MSSTSWMKELNQQHKQLTDQGYTREQATNYLAESVSANMNQASNAALQEQAYNAVSAQKQNEQNTWKATKADYETKKSTYEEKKNKWKNLSSTTSTSDREAAYQDMNRAYSAYKAAQTPYNIKAEEERLNNQNWLVRTAKAVGGGLADIGHGVAQTVVKAGQVGMNAISNMANIFDEKEAGVYQYMSDNAGKFASTHRMSQDEWNSMSVADQDFIKNQLGISTLTEFNSNLASADRKKYSSKESAESTAKTQAVFENAISPLDTYSQRMANEATYGTTGLGKLALEMIPSAVGMAFDAATGGITGGPLASMGLRVFGSSYADAKKQGSDDGRATLYALLDTAKEIGTELIGGEAVTNALVYKNKGLFNSAVDNLISRIPNRLLQGITLHGVGALEESLEEVAGTFLDPFVQAVLESDYGAAVREKFGEQRGMDYARAAAGAALLTVAGLPIGAITGTTSARLNEINTNSAIQNNPLLVNQYNSDVAKGIDADTAKAKVTLRHQMGEDVYAEYSKQRSDDQNRAAIEAYAKADESVHFNNVAKGQVLLNENDDAIGKVVEANEHGFVVEMKGSNGKTIRQAVVKFGGRYGMLDSNSALANGILNQNWTIMDEGYARTAEERAEAEAKATPSNTVPERTQQNQNVEYVVVPRADGSYEVRGSDGKTVGRFRGYGEATSFAKEANETGKVPERPAPKAQPAQQKQQPKAQPQQRQQAPQAEPSAQDEEFLNDMADADQRGEKVKPQSEEEQRQAKLQQLQDELNMLLNTGASQNMIENVRKQINELQGKPEMPKENVLNNTKYKIEKDSNGKFIVRDADGTVMGGTYDTYADALGLVEQMSQTPSESSQNASQSASPEKGNSTSPQAQNGSEMPNEKLNSKPEKKTRKKRKTTPPVTPNEAFNNAVLGIDDVEGRVRRFRERVSAMSDQELDSFEAQLGQALEETERGTQDRQLLEAVAYEVIREHAARLQNRQTETAEEAPAEAAPETTSDIDQRIEEAKAKADAAKAKADEADKKRAEATKPEEKKAQPQQEGKRPYQEARREQEAEPVKTSEQTRAKENVAMSSSELEEVYSADSTDYRTENVDKPLTKEQVDKLPPDRVIGRLASWAKKLKLGGLRGLATRYGTLVSEMELAEAGSPMQKEYIDEASDTDFGSRGTNTRSVEEDQAEWNEIQKARANDTVTSLFGVITRGKDAAGREKRLNSKFDKFVRYMIGSHNAQIDLETARAEYIRQLGFDIDYSKDTLHDVLNKIAGKYPELTQKMESKGIVVNPNTNYGPFEASKSIRADQKAEIDALFQRALGIGVSGNAVQEENDPEWRQRLLSDILYDVNSEESLISGIDQYYDYSDEALDEDGNIIGNTEQEQDTTPTFESEEDKDRYEQSWWARNKKRLVEDAWRERVYSEQSLVRRYATDAEGRTLYLAETADGETVLRAVGQDGKMIVPKGEAEATFVKDDKGRKVKADAAWSSNIRYDGEKGNKDFARGIKYRGQYWVLKTGDARFGNIIKGNISDVIRGIYNQHQQVRDEAQRQLDDITNLKDDGALKLVPTAIRPKATPKNIKALRDTISREQAILDNFDNANYSEESGSYKLDNLLADDILTESERNAIAKALGKDFERTYGNMTVHSLMDVMSEQTAREIIDNAIKESTNAEEFTVQQRATDTRGRTADDGRGVGGTQPDTGNAETSSDVSAVSTASESGTGTGAGGGQQPGQLGNNSTSGHDFGEGSGETGGSGSPVQTVLGEQGNARQIKKHTNRASYILDLADTDRRSEAAAKTLGDMIKAAMATGTKQIALTVKAAIKRSGGMAVTRNGIVAMVYNDRTLEQAKQSDSRFSRFTKFEKNKNTTFHIADGFAFAQKADNWGTRWASGQVIIWFENGVPHFDVYAPNYDVCAHETMHVTYKTAMCNLFRHHVNGLIKNFDQIRDVSNQWLNEKMQSSFDEAGVGELFTQLKDRLISHYNYSEVEALEELYVELSARSNGGTFSTWTTENGKYFDEIGRLLKNDSPQFKQLMKEIAEASDGKLPKRTFTLNNDSDASFGGSYINEADNPSNPAATGNSQMGVVEDYGINNTMRNGDVDWGDTAPREAYLKRSEQQKLLDEMQNELQDMYQNDPNHNDTKATEWWEDDSYVPNEDHHNSNWEKQYKGKLTGEQIFSYERETNPEDGPEAADEAKKANPWNRIKDANRRITRVSRGSALNNAEKMDRITGGNSGARNTVRNYQNLTKMIDNVMSGKANVVQMYHMLEDLRGSKGIGQIVDDRIVNLFHDVANYERAVYAAGGPESQTKLALTYKYAMANAMDALTNNIERVNNIEYDQKLKLIKNAEQYGKGGSNSAFVQARQWLNRMQMSGGNFWRMIDGYNRGADGIGYQWQKRHDAANATQIETQANAFAHFAGLSKVDGFADFANGKAKGEYGSLLQEVSLYKMMNTVRREYRKYNPLTKERELKVDWSRVTNSKGFDIVDNKGKVVRHIEANEDLDSIFEILKNDIENNKAATAYMNAMDGMFGELAPELAKTSKNVLGYERTMYDFGKYFPVSYMEKGSNGYNYNMEEELGAGLSGFGNMKTRKQQVEKTYQVAPASMVVDQYIQQASNYVAYAEIGADLKLMLDGNGNTGSFMDVVGRQFGSTYGQWFKNYVKDMNGIKTEDPSGVNKWLARGRGLMQQGAIIGSVSIPIKQTASYFNAMGVVDPRAVAMAYKGPTRSGNAKRINNPFMQSRTQGSIDPEVSQFLRSDWVTKMRNKGGAAATLVNMTNIMDARTVANVYEAVLLDVQMNSGFTTSELIADAKSGQLTAMGEMLVNSKFEEAVLNTQPIFTKQARPELSRTSNEFIKMLSTFRTQQMQNYNRMLTSINEYRAAKTYGGDTVTTGANLRATIGGQIASAASLAALTCLADAVLHKLKKYKDDDGEIDPGKVLGRWGLNTVESLTGNVLFLGDLTKWAYDKVRGALDDNYTDQEFYGISMGAISSVRSVLNACSWLYSDIKDYGGRHVASNTRYVVNYISTLAGIPTQNAYAIVNSFVQWTAGIDGRGESEDILKEWDKARTDYGNRFYNYIAEGKTDKANAMMEKMGDSFLTKLKATGLQRLQSGESDDDDVFQMLTTYGGMFNEAAQDAISSMHYQIDTGSKLGSMKDDWMEGTITREEAIAYQQKYKGKTKAEAEKLIQEWERDRASQAVYGYSYSNLDDAYRSGYLSDSAYKAALQNIGGKTAEEAEATVNQQNFKEAFGESWSKAELARQYAAGNLNDSQYIKWYMLCEGATEDSAQYDLDTTKNEIRFGHTSAWSYQSDYNTAYASKNDKLGIDELYDQYGGYFRNEKSLGQVFNDFEDFKKTSKYGEMSYDYKGVKTDMSAEMVAKVKALNKNIANGNITYEAAKIIWNKKWGNSLYASGPFQYVKAA